MSLRRVIREELRSDAAAQVNRPMVKVGGPSRIGVHILTAPAALVQIQGGSSDNGAEANILTMISAAGGGYAAATTMGAGFFTIVDRPEWIRFVVATDAGGPRNFRAAFIIDPEE